MTSETTPLAGQKPRVTAVVLAYGDEPVLEESISAIVDSIDVDADVVLVDNGCTSDVVERMRRRRRVTVIDPGRNTGYAAGCNLGASHATGDYLAFINGDAVVERSALRALVEVLTDDSIALASASLRLYGDRETMNSAGNPVHFTGLSWAGGLGEPASAHSRSTEIASATGAAVAVRADRFRSLHGFCELMFAYCEDAELSLRCWQRGWRVVYVPEAVVAHRYEFTRNPAKLYLLERNRLILVLTLFERRTLLRLLPPLILLEVLILAVSLKQGWAMSKVRGWVWLWSHRQLVRERRARVQADRSLGDESLLALMTGDFAPGASTGFGAPKWARKTSMVYWSMVRASFRNRGERPR